MNAVACLAGDASRLDAAGREQLEPFLCETARIQAIIRAVIDACLGLKGEIGRDGAPLFEYPVIPEGGEEKRPDQKAPSPPPASGNISVIFRSLQVNSLAGTLGEAFGGFASQTAALAGIFSPPRIPQAPPAAVTGRADTGTVFKHLGRSASVLHHLETIRTDLARTLFYREPAMGSIPVTGTGLQPPPAGEPPLHAPAGTSGALHGGAAKYAEPLGTMFAPLHGMLQRSERLADILLPLTVPMEHPPLPGVTGPGTGRAGAEYPVTVRHGEGIPLQAVTPGLPAMSPESQERQKQSARRTQKTPPPGPGAGIIEIPALMPGGSRDLRTGMAAMNAERLAEGMARLAGRETAETVIPLRPEGGALPALRLLPGADRASPAVSVPAAFEKIAQYVTHSAEVHRQVTESLAERMTSSGEGTGIFSVPLPFVPNNAGGGISFSGITLQGKDIGSAEYNPVMNIAVSMLAGDAMRRAGPFPLSTSGGARHPGMLSPGALLGALPSSPLFSLEHALPLSAGTRSEPSLPAAGGGTAVHFQNTFNISVTTRGGGDEAELRELGRKIGVILSDELKRYGGLR